MPHLWDVLDLIAKKLQKKDLINLQATCRALRSVGMASEVVNEDIFVQNLSPDDFESFSLWLQPRAFGIRELDMTSRNGEIPEGLWHLQRLRKLRLVGVSVLPPTVATLSELRILQLQYCEELEALPECVTSLRKLGMLNLRRCINLRTLPSSLSVLTNLRDLCFDSCGRLEITPAVWKIKSLISLDLTNVPWKDKDLDEGLWDMQNLRSLTLPGNYLPPELGQLTQLTYLHLERDVTEIPEDSGLWKLANLDVLDISRCQNMHTLPPQISELSGLKELGVNFSGITTLPPEVEHLRQLKFLSLICCPKLVEVPAEIGLLTSLTKLELLNCTALKSLPPTIRSLPSLLFM